ncbi:MAG TPA: hypothetical protein VFU11_07865 [Solirubrobacterales bacterium]|nr:hypothetical protein [Solirubrobacterales bacterium]
MQGRAGLAHGSLPVPPGAAYRVAAAAAAESSSVSATVNVNAFRA